MSQTTPKSKDAGRTNSQESPSSSSKKNNQNNPNEESKDPSQNQNQKKGWSLGSWFKKPKTSPGNDTTKDDSTHSTEEEIMKSKPKKLEKFGNYAKSLLKGIADNVQSSFMEPAALGDPVWGDFPSPSAPVNKTEETKNENEDSDEEEYEEDEDEIEEGDEENEGEEDDDEEDEDEEDSEEDEEKGYEEDEGSLDEEQDKQETPKEPAHSDDNFAIDDDEPEPIQHPNPDSQEEISEEQKAAGVAVEKAKAKKTKKGKGKKKSKKEKEKAKRKKRREPKASEGVVLEDVFVNKRYVYGAPFTDFHQFYFKGDYLDFDPDEFFRVELVNEKGGLTNLIFNEKKYIAIQDQIFYFMKLEKIDTFDLGLVLESYPLSRLVRLDKVDKKKRIDLSFYTEDSIGNPNQQREFVLEVKNYAKFVKVIDQHLTTINSSFHILRYNIE